MAIKTILFDFDGTVANTNRLIIDSWQHVFRTVHGKEADEADIKATFGEPLGISMVKNFPDMNPEDAIDMYRSHQKDIYEEMIEPFPGIVELLKGLKEKGYQVGIVTSRLRNSTMIGLRKFGLAETADCIVTCEDTDKHKPDPEPALIALEKLSAKAEETLMVGDSMFDIKCAHNAGIKAVMVGWAEAITEADLTGPDRPEYCIEKAEDLYDIL
ncbi:MAG: HAD-IIIA family hydrolase [Emergencia sp.]|nr:HAD-IIIA family hydrolase [Emergencia sp.]